MSKRSRKLKIDLSGRHGDMDADDNTPNLNDENISSDEDEDIDHRRGEGDSVDEAESDEEEEETVDAKRLRMAREYLSKVEALESSSQEDESSEESEGDYDDHERVKCSKKRRDEEPVDKVGQRIAKDRMRKSGLLQTRISNSVLEGVQSMRGEIARRIGLEAASVAWMDGGVGGDGSGSEDYAKSWLDAKYVTYHRGHDLTPTCVALCQSGHTAFSGSKDGSIVMWNVAQGGKKVSCILPPFTKQNAHTTKGAAEVASKNAQHHHHRNDREILAIATSDDDRYMAVGGRDNSVRIFDIRTFGKSSSSGAHTPISTLGGHKKPVTALTFRSRTLDLYSGSEDRCIRRYDLNAMTYVETLYGHQSPIVAIACANKNRPVSVARDRTVRVWKVEEDSHLVFRPGGDVGSAECVSAFQDGWFVTGHEDGRLALWREEKKRPVGREGGILAAHGYQNGGGAVARSVMCCDALGLSDVLATGSNDGYLRFWKVSTDEKDSGIEPLESVPLHGHINGIAMGPGGKFCVAAVGQEPRLGRWDRVPRAKNRFAIIKLNREMDKGDDE